MKLHTKYKVLSLFVITNAFCNSVLLIFIIRSEFYLIAENNDLRASFFIFLILQNVFILYLIIERWFLIDKNPPGVSEVIEKMQRSEIHEINNAITILVGNVIQLKEKMNLKDNGTVFLVHLEKIETNAIKISRAFLGS